MRLAQRLRSVGKENWFAKQRQVILLPKLAP
jgi:hypothetical protein